MTGVQILLPSLIVALAVAVAAAPLGTSSDVSFVLQIMPYMLAHLFLTRGNWLVPSPVLFLAGLGLDLATDGPFGFWAWIYLFGVLVTRQLPEVLLQSRLGRFSALVLVIFAVATAQVALASLYQLRWVDWHDVLAGTMAAGGVAAFLDFFWRGRGAGRRLNVTERGGGGAHV